MSKFKKVLTLIILSIMLTISSSAGDVVAFENSFVKSSSDAEIQGGYCVNCGGTGVANTEFCSVAIIGGIPSNYYVPCTEHSSCNILNIVAMRKSGSFCTACRTEISAELIPGTDHVEMRAHETNGKLGAFVQVCSRNNHLHSLVNELEKMNHIKCNISATNSNTHLTSHEDVMKLFD